MLQRDIVLECLDDGSRRLDGVGIEDSFDILYEVDERVRTGLWVGDCFIYTNSSWRLNYCVGGEVEFVDSDSHEILYFHAFSPDIIDQHLMCNLFSGKHHVSFGSTYVSSRISS